MHPGIELRNDQSLRDAHTLCKIAHRDRLAAERVLVAGDINALSTRDPYPHDFADKLQAAGTEKYGMPPRFDSRAARCGAFDWHPTGHDTYVVHQVSRTHTKAVCDTLGLELDRFPLIYPGFGNIGPAGVPTVLSKSVQDGTITSGDKVMLLGVGSGINTAAAEIAW